MRAIDRFNESAFVAQSLWEAQQDAVRVYRRERAKAAAGDKAAQQLVQIRYRLWHALVQAAAVRLTTAWEVFLQDLFREYLTRRPNGFKIGLATQGHNCDHRQNNRKIGLGASLPRFGQSQRNLTHISRR